MNYEEHIAFTERAKGGRDDDDFYRRADAARETSQEEALHFVAAFTPDIGRALDGEIPDVFGARWAENAGRAREVLREECCKEAEHVMALGIRTFEYAKRQSSAFLRHLIALSPSPDDGQFDQWLTPDSYADREGWANVAYDALSDLKLPASELVKGLQMSAFPRTWLVLDALGVFWFFEAARLLRAGDCRSMDVLFESANAFRLASHEFGWMGAEEMHKGQSQDDPVRLLAKKAASARHAENREIAARIQDWFIENHHSYRSMDAAAEAVTRIEPIAFRTARKHIGDAAKTLPSARKA